MKRTGTVHDADIDSNALLAAYQLLIETTVEGGSDDEMLQRTLSVVAAVPWPTPHRFFSALLPGAGSVLRLAASIAGTAAPASPCADATAAACLCLRALSQPGRLLCVDAAAGGPHPACNPSGTGTHLILPLTARGQVLGVLHALVEPGAPPSDLEKSFLVQVATLLGAELHRRRGEREHDRLETQFLQAQKMEAVGRLAGGVAHDFNNILTAITNYADLGLLKIPPDSPLRRNFEQIIDASDRAAQLTQQLLAFSRREAITPRVIDLNAVLGDLGKMIRRLLGPDMDFTIRTAPGLARIAADPSLIEQMIINLMVNVREALPRGGAVAVETADVALDAAYTTIHPDVAPGDYVRLTVGVSGAGADRALCRPCDAGQSTAAGSALGPAAIFDIIRQCGGNTALDSAPDRNATLQINFPAASADAVKAAPAGDAHRMPRGSETILLAEDDDSVRVVMAEILRDLGYHVLEAREGSEALAVAASHPGRIHALVADVVLPGCAGAALSPRMCPAQPDLHVLLISGVGEEAVARQRKPDRGSACLQKPFSPWAFASMLREVLDAPSPPPRPS